MNIRKFPSLKVWNPADGIPRYKMAKFDGFQVIVSRDETGRIRAQTRTPTDITDKIGWALEPLLRAFPNNCQIAGELWYPGGDCSSVSTAIAKSDTRLRWDAFAVMVSDEFDDETPCEEICKWMTRRGIPHIGVHYPLTENLKKFEKDMLENQMTLRDVEGWILKDANLLNVTKWKPELTIDLIITGHEDGKPGKYEGLLGALKCSTKEGYEVAKVSGMDEATRYELSVNSDEYIGRVIEVEYQTVGSQGRLRHPRFNRFRVDKAADDCSVWQDERLVRHWHIK